MPKSVTFFIFLSLSLIGCGPKDDPEVLEKLEETVAKTELTEEELDMVEAEIKRIRIKDPSEDLAALKLQLEEAEAKSSVLEAEILEVEKAQEKAEKDLAAYKNKYRLR